MIGGEGSQNETTIEFPREYREVALEMLDTLDIAAEADID